MAFKDGDFILIDYTAKVKETGDIIETTLEDVAKEAGLHSEEKKYEPMLVIIGEGRVVRGLEEKLKELGEGEEAEFDVPPEKAYGKRDPSRLRKIPLREFRKAEIEPIPGRVVEINGVPAVVRDVSGGRVLVDFNHPLAGKTIVYKVKVVRHVSDDVEKIRLLLKRRIKPKDLDKFKLDINREEGTLEILVPEDEIVSPDIQLAKKALARDVFNYIDWARKVIFKEVLETKKEKEEKKEEVKEKEEKQAKEETEKTEENKQ